MMMSHEELVAKRARLAYCDVHPDALSVANVPVNGMWTRQCADCQANRIPLMEWLERRIVEMDKFLSWCLKTNAKMNTEADWALLYAVYVTMLRDGEIE